MALTTMYAGKSNSPKTILTADLSANANSLTVADASVLPDAPNIAVIGNSVSAEVVIYSGKNGNILTGLIRGAGQTSASSWPQDTVVARNFTLLDYNNICANILDLDSRKKEKTEKVDVSKDISGTVSVSNGGTGTTSVNGIKSLLGLAALAYKATVNLASDIIGVLPITNGGTGLSSSPSMLVNLASKSTANILAASPRPGITGTLPASNGGTGQTSLQATRNAMGLGNTTGALPIANGGTGASTAANALANIGAAASDHTHTTVVDSGNNGKISFQYSGAGMSSVEWLAAWDGYKIRAVDTNVVKSRLGLANITNIINRPDYTITTTDLTDGESSLASGKLYFVY